MIHKPGCGRPSPTKPGAVCCCMRPWPRRTVSGADDDVDDDELEDEDDLPNTDFLTGDIVLFEQGQPGGSWTSAAACCPPRRWPRPHVARQPALVVRGRRGASRPIRHPARACGRRARPSALDRAMSRQLEPLDVLCTRLLPDGGGGVTVHGGSSSQAAPPRGAAIPGAGRRRGPLRWLVAPAPRHAPEHRGRASSLVTATYRLPDLRRLRRVLAAASRSMASGSRSCTIATASGGSGARSRSMATWRPSRPTRGGAQIAWRGRCARPHQERGKCHAR
jgi:hypothetical protein